MVDPFHELFCVVYKQKFLKAKHCFYYFPKCLFQKFVKVKHCFYHFPKCLSLPTYYKLFQLFKAATIEKSSPRHHLSLLEFKKSRIYQVRARANRDACNKNNKKKEQSRNLNSVPSVRVKSKSRAETSTLRLGPSKKQKERS